MLEVADIFRRHGAAYRAQHLLPSHAGAAGYRGCRTATLAAI